MRLAGLGIWFLSTGVADLAGGWFSGFYAVWAPSSFFGLAAALSAASAAFIWWLTPILVERALSERKQLGFAVSPVASPQPSPVMGRALMLDDVPQTWRMPSAAAAARQQVLLTD